MPFQVRVENGSLGPVISTLPYGPGNMNAEVSDLWAVKRRLCRHSSDRRQPDRRPATADEQGQHPRDHEGQKDSQKCAMSKLKSKLFRERS